MSTYQTLPHAAALNARVSFFGVTQPKTSFLAQLRTAITVASTRRALSKMDAATLNDIGLSAKEARLEAQRSFWDVAPQCAR